MADELVEQYEEYLARFQAELGNVEVGAFAKYNGQIIKKLTQDEFLPHYREYMESLRDYLESLERGDTINDLMVKLLRQRATKLVLPNPA